MSETLNAVFGNDTGAEAITEGLISGEFEKPARMLFLKAILAFLGDKVQPTAEQTKAIINADTKTLTILISQGLGLHENIIKALMALVLRDNDKLI